MVEDLHIPGAKQDSEKPMAELLLDFSRALEAVAKVGTFGARKYTPGGWVHVSNGYARYTGAMLRHLLAEQKYPLDSETGLEHSAHAAWNALARLELHLRALETDTGEAK